MFVDGFQQRASDVLTTIRRTNVEMFDLARMLGKRTQADTTRRRGVNEGDPTAGGFLHVQRGGFARILRTDFRRDRGEIFLEQRAQRGHIVAGGARDYQTRGGAGAPVGAGVLMMALKIGVNIGLGETSGLTAAGGCLG